MDGYLLVNAELDSMGGVIDSGGGIALKTSPRRTAIEKAQAELRYFRLRLLLLSILSIF